MMMCHVCNQKRAAAKVSITVGPMSNSPEDSDRIDALYAGLAPRTVPPLVCMCVDCAVMILSFLPEVDQKAAVA
jgi:hypothetical protein